MYIVSIADMKLQKAACLCTGLCYHRAVQHAQSGKQLLLSVYSRVIGRIDAAHDGMYLLHHYPTTTLLLLLLVEVKKKR